MPWYCYIIECENNFLYTGITKDIEKRFKDHQTSKKGAKFTKKNKPIRIVWQEEQENYSTAIKREMEIKAWRKKRKMKFIEDSSQLKFYV